MVAYLCWVNALVLVFNLLPAFPMDGGRIARAIVWWVTGDRVEATRIAATMGQAFAYLFIAAGIYMFVTGNVSRRALAGIDRDDDQRLRQGANVQTAISSRIEGVRVTDVMDREPVAIPVETERRAGARRVLPPLPLALVPGDRCRPPLPRPARARPADEVPEVTRATANVADLLERDRGLFTLRRRPARLAARQPEPARFGALMAVDADGRLSGVVTAEQVGRALRDAST